MHGLRVDAADLGQLLARPEIEESADDARRANIEGHAVARLRRIARFDVDYSLIERRDGQTSAFRSKSARQTTENLKRNFTIHLETESGADLLQIRRLMMLLAGRRRENEGFANARLELEAVVVGSDAPRQDLMAALRMSGHGDDGAITDDFGLARQPEPLLQGVGAKLNDVLHCWRRQFTLEHFNPAAPAAPTRAACRGDLDLRLESSVENRAAAW